MRDRKIFFHSDTRKIKEQSERITFNILKIIGIATNF